MPVNKATLDLITKYEGVVLTAYADPAHGWKVPTIGIGHTSAAGPPVVKKGMRITKTEATEILLRDLLRYEKAVDTLVTVPLNENQRGALVSFTFNLGEGNLKKSSLLRLLNAGDYAGAAAQFKRWDKAAGKTLPGLTKRRAAEMALFLAPVSGGTVEPPVSPQAPSQSNWLASLIAAIIQLLKGLVRK